MRQASPGLRTSVACTERWKASAIFFVVCGLSMDGLYSIRPRKLLTDEPNPLTAAIINLPPAWMS